MGSLILVFLLSIPVWSQPLPYSFKKSEDGTKPDSIDATSVQEDFEFLANMAHQNKAAINGLTVSAGVQNVTASAPLSSSGGSNPNITFSGPISGSLVSGNISGNAASITGTITESQVVGLVPGISSQCASGFVLSPITVVNGITTGGICVASGTGGSGLAFAGNIDRSIILISTGMNAYDVMTQNTDGTLSLVSTTTATTTLKFLSNSSFTSWITADNSDNALRERQTSITIKLSDLAMFDSNNQAWDISMDLDGVIRTTLVGGL